MAAAFTSGEAAVNVTESFSSPSLAGVRLTCRPADAGCASGVDML